MRRVKNLPKSHNGGKTDLRNDLSIAGNKGAYIVD